MYIPDIIKKKRDREELNENEIRYMISNYASGKIPDYQMSAFIMACFIQGMSKEETVFLTRSMIDTGDVYEFKGLEGIIADKHSTGGVGDKVSIPLAPLLAEAGIYVPMVSGRGLGHTGGTLDKLESIRNFNVNLSKSEFMRVLKKNRVVMAGQTDRFVPADKKLYALRDVTGCVESLPLITASIMSKKLAEGAQTLLLDVKYGNGAFMKTYKSAKALADAMFDLGTAFGRKMIYMITDMSQPLGETAGNGIEIMESMEILKGESISRASLLVKEMFCDICMKNSMFRSRKDAEAEYGKIISSGRGFERFKSMISMQNGETSSLTEKELVHSEKREIKAVREGYIQSFDTYKIGVSLIYAHAGRFRKEDPIDHKAGIRIHSGVGDRVEKGDPLFTLFCRKGCDESYKMLSESVLIGDEKENPAKLIRTKRGNS